MLLSYIIAAVLASVDPVYEGIEREIVQSDVAITARQKQLKDRVSVDAYRALVKTGPEGEIWTAALQKALDEHEIVTIPAREEKYFIDATVFLPGNRRIEAAGATMRLTTEAKCVMLATKSAADGTWQPIDKATRSSNIAIGGGRWEDSVLKRAGYGSSGRLGRRAMGDFYGVSTLFYLGNANSVTVKDATFHHCGGFSIQIGDASEGHLEHIRFDHCFADGIHMNGNLERVHIKDVRGEVGDDLVALNAYDWLNSSVNFGPQRCVIAEDLELTGGYPATRILPAKYRYKDGSIVDCSISQIILRRVKGIDHFKMYLQPPRWKIGGGHEWGETGSGGDIFFEDLEIRMGAPIENNPRDPKRGHYAPFMVAADMSRLSFKNLTLKIGKGFDPEFGHLIAIGPLSWVVEGKDGAKCETFAPWVSNTVKKLEIEGVRIEGGNIPELLHLTAFDNINGDGDSSGCGRLE